MSQSTESMITPLSPTPSSALSATDWLSSADLVPLQGDRSSHFPDIRFLHNSAVRSCFLSSIKILIILPLSQSTSSLPTRLSAPSPTNVLGDSIRTISDVGVASSALSALDAASASRGKKRAHSNQGASSAEKTHLAKRVPRGEGSESDKNSEGSTYPQACFTILEGRAKRHEITHISLLPDIAAKLQDFALGQFVPCSYNKIEYTYIFLANVCPRALVVVFDSHIRLRNVIYTTSGTLSQLSFEPQAKEFITSMVKRSAILGQPIELGEQSIVFYARVCC